MIRIADKSACTGCTACVCVCPKQCIVMRRDRQGFDYPVANPDICIKCGKCESVCPALHPENISEPLSAYAVRADAHLSAASSGGAFLSIAQKALDMSAVVYGAVMNSDMTVGHSSAEDMSGVRAMTGSKYLQSDLYSCLEEIRTQLESGRKVLFTGTPCQVAGLRSYLGKPYPDLVTADIACHGVPSPGLWEKYVSALETRHGSKVRSVNFRDKSRSWRKYDFTVEFSDGSISRTYHHDDPYMALFLQDMTLRPSCYSCPARNGRSGSDITMADLWNVAECVPELDDDKGVSLVFANSARGREFINSCPMELMPVDKECALKRNSGLSSVPDMPYGREEFFRGIHSASDLYAYMKGHVVGKMWYESLYERIHSILSSIKRRLFK